MDYNNADPRTWSVARQVLKERNNMERKQSPEMKPRIRVMHDDTGEIKEVRLIFRAPELRDKTVDEFGDAITVTACSNTNSIANISIDTTKLSGKIYEGKLLELLAQHHRYKKASRHRPGSGVHSRVQKIITECEVLFGKERIEKMQTHIQAKRIRDFGKLDELIEQGLKKRDGETEEPAKVLAEWVQNFYLPNRFKIIDELYVVCMEDHGGNYLASHFFNNVMTKMGGSNRQGYLQYLIDNSALDVNKFQYVFSPGYAGEEATQKTLDEYKVLYKSLNARYLKANENEEEQSTIANIIRTMLDYLEQSVAGNDKLTKAAIEWLKESPGKHPDETVSKYALSYVDAFGKWDEDDDIDPDIDLGLYANLEIADAGIPPVQPPQQGVGDFMANEVEKKAWNEAMQEIDKQNGPILE